jgi:hypothetical protein
MSAIQCRRGAAFAGMGGAREAARPIGHINKD